MERLHVCYCPVRKSPDRDWEYVDYLCGSCDLETSRQKAADLDAAIPDWAACHPIVRFGLFELIEIKTKEEMKP